MTAPGLPLISMPAVRPWIVPALVTVPPLPVLGPAAPHPTRAREDPGGPDVVVTRPADNGGIPVPRKCYGSALKCVADRAGAGKLRALLAPHPARAREDPRGPDRAVT